VSPPGYAAMGSRANQQPPLLAQTPTAGFDAGGTIVNLLRVSDRWQPCISPAGAAISAISSGFSPRSTCLPAAGYSLLFGNLRLLATGTKSIRGLPHQLPLRIAMTLIGRSRLRRRPCACSAVTIRPFVPDRKNYNTVGRIPTTRRHLQLLAGFSTHWASSCSSSPPSPQPSAFIRPDVGRQPDAKIDRRTRVLGQKNSPPGGSPPSFSAAPTPGSSAAASSSPLGSG